MKRRALFTIPLILMPVVFSATSEYLSARQKFEMIESDRLKPGSWVTLTSGELNAYVAHELEASGADGVRNPRLQLGSGTATGSALVDFSKLRKGEQNKPGWLMSQLLEGERPVRVTARVQSGGGQATVDVQKVEISGVAIQGAVLDFLIRNYLLPRYPAAKIGEPFQLSHRIEKLDLHANQVGILIGR